MPRVFSICSRFCQEACYLENMILMDVDTKPTYEAMKRGEWPEPNPEVVAAQEALNISVAPVPVSNLETQT